MSGAENRRYRRSGDIARPNRGKQIIKHGEHRIGDIRQHRQGKNDKPHSRKREPDVHSTTPAFRANSGILTGLS